MYNQGGQFFSRAFKSRLIEQEYGIKKRPDSSGNPHVNATIERIHQVLGNIVHSYNLQKHI